MQVSSRADARPDVVFVGTADETFTPVASGAIATVMHELALQATNSGSNPLVVAKESQLRPFCNVNAIFFESPAELDGGIRLVLRRAERKLRGWRRLRQGEWMRRMAKLLAPYNGSTWILHNEPELALMLQRRFRSTRIIHHFANQLNVKAIIRRTYPQSPLLTTAVSKFTAKWIEEHYRLPAGSVPTVYNGVDSGHFCPAGVTKAGPPVISFVGRTGIEKAPDILLRACLKLTEITTNFALQIVGSNYWEKFELDDYQRELMELTGKLRECGVEVRTLGHVGRAQLPEVMRQAHIHVVPSRWDEPFGLTTLEGMACGLATVASNTGGTPEVIGEAGLLFQREDTDELSSILGKLILDEPFRLAVAKRCRERALLFSWNAMWRSFCMLADSSPNFERDSRTADSH